MTMMTWTTKLFINTIIHFPCILIALEMPPHTITSSHPFFQSIQAKWIHLPTTTSSTNNKRSNNHPYPPRSGHVTFEMGKSIFSFGGYAEEQDQTLFGNVAPNRYAVNDLWELSLSAAGDDSSSSSSSVDAATGDCGSDIKQEWKLVECVGDIPEPRLVSTSAVFANGRAYIFGGWNSNKNNKSNTNPILDDVHSFDHLTKSWKKLPIQLPDGPTSRHITLTLPPSKTKALIHNHRCINHVWIFDSNSEKFYKQMVTGSSPSSRGLHAACVLDTNHILFFGGASQNGLMSNESYLLNIETWHWNKIEIVNDAAGIRRGDENYQPRERAAPCLVRYNDQCAILYGGATTSPKGLEPLGDVWALFVDTSTYQGCWKRLVDSKSNSSKDVSMPPPRNAATLNEISLAMSSVQNSITKNEHSLSTRAKYFLLHGGWAPFRKTYGGSSDSFVLEISSSPASQTI